MNANNEEEIRLSTYFSQNKSRVKSETNELKRFKYKIGDHVRITYLKNVFTRAYDQTYSGEVFVISKRYHRGILSIYRLNDLQNEDIRGTFYESELQKVDYDENTSFKIDKIIKTKGKGLNKQLLVNWKHYPNRFNSWIKTTDIQ